MIDRKEFEEAKRVQQAFINQERLYKSLAGNLLYIARDAVPVKEVFRYGISSKLVKAGIESLGDLIDYNGTISKDVKGLGFSSVKEIKEQLKMLGMFVDESKIN